MSEPSNGAWPFQEIPEEEGLDISAIFGDSSAAPQGDPFAPPAAAQSVPSSPTPVAQEITPAVAATSQPTTAPIAKAPVEAPAENPIAAAFEQKTAENTKKGLLEKPPVFYHKGVKEEIDDPSMTFEELRIRKSDDFTDLEEGKRVSWSVEYCGIRKEVKDPKGTTIISMKEMIERSREFLDALKKTKDKDPCCYVKPKVEMKTKGNAAYKGKFGTLEEARNSDKVICLIPSNDGRIYELRKMEQGEFIAPKKNVVDFSEVRAGFSPALPKIPAELMGQIIAFFRAFMTDHGENEAFAQIYWDKAEKRFFAYVPKQSVCKEEVEANLHDCPYDDEERYLCYADIHSHNSMDAFFSGSQIEVSPSVLEPAYDGLTDEEREDDFLNILDACELTSFTPGTALVFENAIERLYYSDSYRIGNATLPQSRVRAKLRRLDGMILREAERKLHENQEQNVKNSTAYTMAVLFNCIAESESDLLVDPYLNALSSTA